MGGFTMLLNTLPLVPGQRVNSPNILSNRLKRVATFLGKIGIEISFDKLGHKRRDADDLNHPASNRADTPTCGSAVVCTVCIVCIVCTSAPGPSLNALAGSATGKGTRGKQRRSRRSHRPSSALKH